MTATSNLLQSSAITQNPLQSPIRITAFGDSLIYGYGDPIYGGWVEQLRRQGMARDSHIIYNLGVRGDTAAQVNQRLDQEFVRRGELRNKLPDVILLSVGVNDSPRVGKQSGKNMIDRDRFTLEMANLLDKAQNLCPVLFVGMVPVNEAKMPFLNCLHFNHEDQYHYKQITKSACQVREIPYIDIFDLWRSRGQDWINVRLCDDGLHPNSEGYRSLLEDITHWQPMQQLLTVTESYTDSQILNSVS